MARSHSWSSTNAISPSVTFHNKRNKHRRVKKHSSTDWCSRLKMYKHMYLVFGSHKLLVWFHQNPRYEKWSVHRRHRRRWHCCWTWTTSSARTPIRPHPQGKVRCQDGQNARRPWGIPSPENGPSDGTNSGIWRLIKVSGFEHCGSVSFLAK